MAPSAAVSASIGLLRVLPLHALSRAAGWLAGLRLPRALRAPLLRAFARIVGANPAEARDPLDSYASLQAFFTRALAPGARPLDPDPRALAAPCDGAWGESGRIEGGTLLQVKGQRYALAALLGDAETAAAFEGGSFATFYLAPRDYHRFHAPCDVAVSRAVHLPGTLWPVNRIGLAGMPGLFAANERIVAFFRAHGSEAENLAIAAVGATLVGKVRVRFPAPTTNRGARGPDWRHYDDESPEFGRGEEWGRFEFGSTLVLAAAPGALSIESRAVGSVLRLGTRIGRIGSS